MADYYIFSMKYSLRTRTTKRGTVYDVVFRVVDKSGAEAQKVLSGYSTKGLAKRAHADFVMTYCEPINREIKIRKKKDKVEFSKAFDQYFSTLSSKVKESSMYTIRAAFKKFFIPYFGDTDISVLTKTDFFAWQEQFFATRNTKTNCLYSYKYLTTLRGFLVAFLTWVYEMFDIPNQLARTKKPKKPTFSVSTATRKELMFWEISDFEKFKAVLPDSSSKDYVYRVYFYLSYYTGCRQGEALALSEADYDGKSIYFYKTYSRKLLDSTDKTYIITTAKQGKQLTVPIPMVLKNELDEYIRWQKSNNLSSTYLFGGDSVLASSTIRRRFDYYTDKAGLKRIRIHDLRHSYASMLIHHGASISAVAELIGDNPEQVMKTYGHLYESDKRKLIDSLV